MSDRTYLEEDLEAVKAVRDGDAGAFTGLVERYFGVVRAVAFARLTDNDAADDLAQEVFLQAYLQINTLRDVSALPAWLITMTRYRASHWQRDHLRRSRVLRLVPLDEVQMEIGDWDRLSPRENAAASERERQLQQAIQQLPEESREIVLLHYGQGLTQRQLASYLGVDTSTVCRRLKRAVDQLRGAFEKDLQLATRPSPSAAFAKSRAIAIVGAAALLTPSARAGIAAAFDPSAMSTVAGGTVATQSAAASSPIAAFIGANKVVVAVAVAIAVIVGPSIYLAQAAGKMRASTTARSMAKSSQSPVLPRASRQQVPSTRSRIRTVAAASTASSAIPAAASSSINQQAIEPAFDKNSTGTLLRGKVVKPDGSPAPGAVVNMFSYAYTKRPAAIATADDQGTFEQPLPTGRYWFYAKQGTLVARDFDMVVIRADGTASREPVIRLQQGGTVFGKVMNTETNMPVADALIITDDGDYVRSGADGTFMIAGIRNGEHSITASKEGLFRPVVYFDTTARPDSEVNINTKPGATLRGIVTDEEGNPIPGASVRDLRSGSIFICATMETKTDGAGRYSLSGYSRDFPIGSVTASAEGYANSTQRELEFPTGTNELEVNYQLSKGAPSASTAPTTAKPVRTISGRVTAEDDTPVSGALVAYGSTTSYIGYVSTLSDSDGRYEIDRAGLANDLLSVQKNGHAPAFTESGTDAPATVNFKLPAAHSLRGKIVDEIGEPISAISVSVMAPVRYAGRQDSFRYLEERTSSDANGEFVLHNLPAGKVSVDFYGGAYSDSRDVALEVDKTDHVIKLDAPGQISGTALDSETGKAISSFIVRLDRPKDSRPEDPKNAGYLAAYSSSGLTFNSPDGTFTISELNAKSILRVEVSAPGYQTASIDRVIVGTTRNISPAENLFRLAKSASLEGTVVTSGTTSQPVGNARVKLLHAYNPNELYFNYVLNDMEDRLRPLVTYTDEHGRFRFPSLSHANPALAVEMEGYGRVIIPDVGTSSTIEVALTPAAVIRGVVSGRGGYKINMESKTKSYTARMDIAPDGSYEFRNVPEGIYWIGWLNGRVYENVTRDAIIEPGKEYTFNSDGVIRTKLPPNFNR